MRDLSDSSLIVRLTRGRGWIALLGALLLGIVALNVVSLSLNTGNGRLGSQIEELERQNSALRADIAEQFSAGRVEGAAARLGLGVPDPQDIHYLDASDADVAKLAKLLSTGAFLSGTPTSYSTETYEPAAYGVVAPDASTPTVATPAPQAEAPAPASSSPSSSTGGGGSPGGTGGVGL